MLCYAMVYVIQAYQLPIHEQLYNSSKYFYMTDCSADLNKNNKNLI